MMASTRPPLSKRRRYSTTAAGERRPTPTAGQALTSPRSTAGRADAITSRRIASSSSSGNSRIGVRSDTVGFEDGRSGRARLPEVDLQRRGVAARRDVTERIAMVRIVLRAALEQVVDLGHAVARLVWRRRPQIV